jgi:thiaminase
LTGKPLNIKDKGQLLAYAQKAYLLEKRTKALEETLTKMQENKDTDKLLKKLKGLEKNNKEYKEITKEIIKKYEIKENDIKDILDKVLVKNNSEERVK